MLALSMYCWSNFPFQSLSFICVGFIRGPPFACGWGRGEMSFDLNITVDKKKYASVDPWQNEGNILWKTRILVIGKRPKKKNQLHSPAFKKQARKSGSHPHVFTQIPHSGDRFQRDGADLLQSTAFFFVFGEKPEFNSCCAIRGLKFGYKQAPCN